MDGSTNNIQQEPVVEATSTDMFNYEVNDIAVNLKNIVTEKIAEIEDGSTDDMMSDVEEQTIDEKPIVKFSKIQEEQFLANIEICGRIFHTLTPKNCQQVAYQTAKSLNIDIPAAWDVKKMADDGWFKSFRKSHPYLKLSYKDEVKAFLDKVENLPFGDGSRVYNLDEIRFDIMEINELKFITACFIVNAIGTRLPPVVIVPDEKIELDDHFDPGTYRLVNDQGQMNPDLFLSAIKHYIQHSNSSPNNPSILIIDNHKAHLSLEAINLARHTGVELLVLNPEEMQPLSIAAYNLYKHYNPNAATASIKQAFNVMQEVLPSFMTAENISDVFINCGLFPFNRIVVENLYFNENI